MDLLLETIILGKEPLKSKQDMIKVIKDFLYKNTKLNIL